jgi:hypothetical protein
MNRENLKTLADYLLRGDLAARFDMREYCEKGYDFDAHCGAVGCAVGHATYCVDKYRGETYPAYIRRAFDLTVGQWAWCFGTVWAHRHNTSRAAGLRILWLLEMLEPEDHPVFDLRGDSESYDMVEFYETHVAPFQNPTFLNHERLPL